MSSGGRRSKKKEKKSRSCQGSNLESISTAGDRERFCRKRETPTRAGGVVVRRARRPRHWTTRARRLARRPRVFFSRTRRRHPARALDLSVSRPARARREAPRVSFREADAACAMSGGRKRPRESSLPAWSAKSMLRETLRCLRRTETDLGVDLSKVKEHVSSALFEFGNLKDECLRCAGRGVTSCVLCGGQGELMHPRARPCHRCLAAGVRRCDECDGYGVESVVASVDDAWMGVGAGARARGEGLGRTPGRTDAAPVAVASGGGARAAAPSSPSRRNPTST